MKRDSNVIGIDIAKRVFHVIGMDTRGTIISHESVIKIVNLYFYAVAPQSDSTVLCHG
jgi:hypothetical protein